MVETDTLGEEQLQLWGRAILAQSPGQTKQQERHATMHQHSQILALMLSHIGWSMVSVMYECHPGLLGQNQLYHHQNFTFPSCVIVGYFIPCKHGD